MTTSIDLDGNVSWAQAAAPDRARQRPSAPHNIAGINPTDRNLFTIIAFQTFFNARNWLLIDLSHLSGDP
jgi:hypothetical protein